MAVSGKTAAPYEFPYLAESDIPDIGAGDKAIADKLQATTWLSQSLKPTRGRVLPSGTLSVLNNPTYTLVPGTEKALTLPAKSILVVRAVFMFQASDTGSPFGAGDFYGGIALDGSTEKSTTARATWDSVAGEEFFSTQGFCQWEGELSAAEHKIKLMAHSAAGSEWDAAKVEMTGTYYEYEVWAA